MNKYLAIGVGVIVIALLGFFLMGNKAGKQTTVSTPAAQTQNQASPSAQPVTSTVTLTQSGFDQQTLKVKVGTKVTWINKSGETATVNSDPHPTHTLWPFLNLGNFDDGMSVSVTFDKAGTYTYHNHLNPNETGTVIVE